MNLKSLFTKESKNFIIISIITVVLSLSAIVTSVVAISSKSSPTNTENQQIQELSTKLQQLQDNLDDTKTTLDDTKYALDKSISELNDLKKSLPNQEGNKIYKAGETVTVYNNGLKLFDITYINNEARTMFFKFTNYNCATSGFADVIKARFYSLSENKFWDSASIINTSIPHRTTVDVRIYHTSNMSSDYIYLGHASDAFTPFAIFEA